MVLPSDPTTLKASEYLHGQGVVHEVIEIPDSLGYRTGATLALYLEGDYQPELMVQLSAEGFVIMRVFQEFRREPSS